MNYMLHMFIYCSFLNSKFSFSGRGYLAWYLYRLYTDLVSDNFQIRFKKKIFQLQERLQDLRMKNSSDLELDWIFFVVNTIWKCFWKIILSSFALWCRFGSLKLLFDRIRKTSVHWWWLFELVKGFMRFYNWWLLRRFDGTAWRSCFHRGSSWRIHGRNTHQFSFLK